MKASGPLSGQGEQCRGERRGRLSPLSRLVAFLLPPVEPRGQMSAALGEAFRRAAQARRPPVGKRGALFTPRKFPADGLESEAGATRTGRATCPDGGAANAQCLVPQKKPSGRESSIVPFPGAPSRLRLGSAARFSFTGMSEDGGSSANRRRGSKICGGHSRSGGRRRPLFHEPPASKAYDVAGAAAPFPAAGQVHRVPAWLCRPTSSVACLPSPPPFCSSQPFTSCCPSSTGSGGSTAALAQ